MPENSMNVLSLFSGIGGLDLGLQRAGMTIIGQVEIDQFCQRVLTKHWPEVARHDDIRSTVEWWCRGPRPRVDLVCGGFPCQPVSTAGRKQGAADARWLWPAMAAVIAALGPDWVVWENVPGLLTRGLDSVHADLVRLGYRHRVGWASACALGAPHPRRRLFGLAHTTGLGRPPGRPEPGDAAQTLRQEARGAPSGVHAWPDEPDVGGGPDGIPSRLDGGLGHAGVTRTASTFWADGSWESGLERVAYGVSHGMDRRTALGNAVVPQVAEHIGSLIMNADHGQTLRARSDVR